jgi:hypothetical protein
MNLQNYLKALTVIALSLIGVAAISQDEMILTQFDSSSPGLRWQIVNDGVMGGRSRGEFEINDEILWFKGSTNTNGGGFSSMRSVPRDLELGEYLGIAMQLKGDGRTYTFLIRQKKSRISYWAKFKTKNDAWEEVRIPFSAFWPNWRGRKLDRPPVAPSEIIELGIMIYDGQDGPFSLMLDQISAW